MYDEIGAYEGEDPGPYWHDQIETAQKTFDKWEKRGQKVVKRYRDERDAIEMPRMKFNILWSNIQVLFPSLYGRQAKPEVSRRFSDQDPVGRLASTMLERVMEYETTQFADFDNAMRGVVEDRLLPGRGTAWIRYEPIIVGGSPEVEGQLEDSQEAQVYDVVEEPVERIDAAHSPIDYVYWADFLHSPARTWDEVWWVARAVYMTKEEGVERFGDVFKNVSLTSQNTDMDGKNPMTAKMTYDKKAKVYEIWNKRSGKVCWIAKGYPQALDERDDPLDLEEFFPCPKPLLATTTTGTMIPVPDYCEYEDQAQELDNLTQRIYLLTKACKAVGVFNAEFKELARMFSEGVDNKLFPVTGWAAMSEKGGLKGAIDMMDTSQIIVTLRELYAAREQVKQSDLRDYGHIGHSCVDRPKPQETLGAQQLKANFGSLRLRSAQGDVARFATDVFKLKAQIICKFYPPELIVEMSGVMNTQDGQNPELLQAAIQMLSNSTIRDFHIQVEADSLAQIDEQAEKQAAAEAVETIGSFLQSSLPIMQSVPEMLPMMSEMLLFLVRRFRAGRGMEGAIEQAMKALSDKAAQAAQQPQQNPEMMKLQADQQAEQMRMQAQAQTEQMKMQADAQLTQVKAQLDMQMQQAKVQAEMQLQQMKAEFEVAKQNNEMQIKAREMAGKEEYERWKAELDAATKVLVAQIGAKAGLDQAALSAQMAASEELDATLGDGMSEAINRLADMHGQTLGQITGVMQAISAPKRIIRGPDGRAAGVEIAI
jgi:hypothetical protein